VKIRQRERDAVRDEQDVRAPQVGGAGRDEGELHRPVDEFRGDRADGLSGRRTGPAPQAPGDRAGALILMVMCCGQRQRGRAGGLPGKAGQVFLRLGLVEPAASRSSTVMASWGQWARQAPRPSQ